MTPSWFKTHASYINRNHSITNDQITFSAGPIMNAALLKVPLVAAGVLEDGAVLTVKITVANDVSIGKKKDGTSFIGFETVDKLNYYQLSPCFAAEGKSGETLTEVQRLDRFIPLPNENFYPDQFVFTLKLDQSRGSCFTPHRGGFIKTAEYTKRLLLSHGLTLEVYKTDRRELVGIKYISITVTINDG
ncbi:uncharacterized protein LOC110042015 [Orbicella faveolata]|uniref:uncharacterized protein LOC110042015 n=1 Tax=Orbicella faveolata TaxID=48498 RepID=UPI0009E2E404|nr:uncharacterized protein LOC110042015 [Orbicella faveolata]